MHGTAKKQRGIGIPFKPGESGNPNGRPPLPPEQKTFRKVTSVSFLQLAQKYISASRDELKAAQDNPTTPALDLMLIAWIAEGRKGDHRASESFLCRIIGKVPDKVEVKQKGDVKKDPYTKETKNYRLNESEEG